MNYYPTYIEAGESLKRRFPGNKALQARDSESLGLEFAEAKPDAVVIGEKRADSPSYEYDPDEGFNVLKALGNIPYSMRQDTADLTAAALSPIQTTKALARTAAGGAEELVFPGSPTPISAANREAFQGFKQGFKESLSDRNVQERPTTAISNALMGASAAAKMAKLGSRAGASMLSQSAKRVDPMLPGSKPPGGLMPESRLTFPSPQKAQGAELLSRLGDVFQRAEEGAQGLDPSMAIMRSPAIATKGLVSVGKYGAEKAFEPAKAAYGSIEKALKESPIAGAIDAMQERASQASMTPTEKIKDYVAKAKVRVSDMGDKAQEQAVKTFDQPVSKKGIFRGLLENAFGFTWNVGPGMVRRMFDIAESDPAGRQVMLDAIRQPDAVVNGSTVSGDAVVARRLLSQINESAKKYYDNATEIHEKMREPLQLDRITVPVADFRAALQDALPPDVRMTGEGVKFGDFYSTSGKKALEEVLTSIYSVGNGNISLAKLDKFKSLIRQALYEGNLESTTDAAKGLRAMYAATRNYIGKIADNPIEMNAQLSTLREADVERFLQSQALTGGGMTGLVPQSLLTEISDAAIKPLVGVGAGDYSAAMRQYFNFQDFMDRLDNDLRIQNPERRSMVQIDAEGKAIMGDGGVPAVEEILRQPGKDREVLRSVVNVFDDESGMSFETLKELAEATDNPTLIAEIIGFNLRPTIAGGLAPRGEIGQAGRSAAGGIAHPLALVATAIEILPAVAVFSPKYGSQILIRAFSPEGREMTNRLGRIWEQKRGQAVSYLKNNVPEEYDRLRRMTADTFKKSPSDVQIDDVAQFFDEYMSLNDEINKLPREDLTRLRDFLRYGRGIQSTQDAQRRSEQRQSLLQKLGRVPARSGGAPQPSR